MPGKPAKVYTASDDAGTNNSTVPVPSVNKHWQASLVAAPPPALFKKWRSRFSLGARCSAPLFSSMRQVVQWQTPPQSCRSGRPFANNTSNSVCPSFARWQRLGFLSPSTETTTVYIAQTYRRKQKTKQLSKNWIPRTVVGFVIGKQKSRCRFVGNGFAYQPNPVYCLINR